MEIGLVFVGFTISPDFRTTKGHLYFITLKVSTKSTAAVIFNRTKEVDPTYDILKIMQNFFLLKVRLA